MVQRGGDLGDVALHLVVGAALGEGVEEVIVAPPEVAVGLGVAAVHQQEDPAAIRHPRKKPGDVVVASQHKGGGGEREILVIQGVREDGA